MPPVFDIGTGGDDLYQEFMRAWVRDGDGVDGGSDCGKGVNDSFKHCGHCEIMLEGRFGIARKLSVRVSRYLDLRW